MVGVMFGRTPVQNVLRTFGRNLEDAFVWLGKKDSAPEEFSRGKTGRFGRWQIP